MPRSLRPTLALGLLAAAALTACGGGGSDSATSSLTDSQALGYAADATTVPASAASGLDNASATLEAVLPQSSGQAATGLATAQGLQQPTATLPPVTAACPGGGTLTWTVSGGTLAQQLNGQLDAGERYDLAFSQCTGAVPGVVLDGAATLTVTAWSDTASDLGLQASALRLGTGNGQFTLDGSTRQQRSVHADGNGGRTTSNHLSSAQLALSATQGGRASSYTLVALDWSVQRSVDSSGAFTASSHQGSVSLGASTTRRPMATLQVSTQGSLTLGADGLASSGSCSLATTQDLLTISYGAGSVTISLDQGKDGSIDHRWTLPRADFLAGAG